MLDGSPFQCEYSNPFNTLSLQHCGATIVQGIEVGSQSIKSKKPRPLEALSGQQEETTQHMRQGFGALWGRGT